MSFDKYSTDEGKKCLALIQKMYHKTKLDGSFQRLGGMDHGSGWTRKASRAYIQSLMEDCVYNKIIVAHVEYCLRHAEGTKDEASRQYFQQLLDEGYEYVSIDGNNTSSTIASFLDGHEDLHYKDQKGNTRKLEDLEDQDRIDVIYSEKLDVAVLREIGIEEMAVLFRRLNMSTKLNDQEHRQARWSGLAKFIREVSNYQNESLDIRKMFLNFVYSNKDNLDKRSHEEMVAQLSYKILRNYQVELQGSSLNSFYNTVDTLDPKICNLVEHILNESARMANTLSVGMKAKLKKGVLQNLWDMIQIVYQRNLKIADHEKFLEYFIDVHTKASAVAKNILAKDEEELSYDYWTANYNKQNDYNRIRQLLSDRLAVDEATLLSDGIIKRKRPSNSYFSFEDKIKLWDLQGYKDRNGQEIKALDLYQGRVQVDHVQSIADGGTTTLANGEAMYAEDNLRKGAKSNEPYFPHQQKEFDDTDFDDTEEE